MRIRAARPTLVQWLSDAGPAWCLAAFLGILVVTAWLFAPSIRTTTSVVAEVIPGIAVFVGIVRFRPAQMRRWALLGLGLLITGVGSGDVMLSGAGPKSTAQDQLLLLAAVGRAIELAGLAGLVAARGSLSRRIGLDLSVLMLAVGLVVWFACIAPALQLADAAAAMPSVVSNLAISLILLGLIARLLLAPGKREPSVWLLSACAFANTLALLTIAYEFSRNALGQNTTVDLLLLLGAVGMSLAVLHPSMASLAARSAREPERARPFRVGAMASAAVLAGPIALVMNPSARSLEDFAVLVLGSSVMFGLIILRMSQALFELDRSHRALNAVEEEMRKQALRDSLTGLPNRAMFGRALEAALRYDPMGAAVLFCDLDDFKIVNDTLGHGFGDRLLVEVAARIRATVRPPDVAARLGGDEFAILLRNADQPTGAVRVAERILESFTEPFVLDGQIVHSRLSIGIALAERGGDPQEAVRNADIAMYLAKSEGKGRYELFRVSLHADVVTRLAIRASLQRAVENHEFLVYYQPIVDLTSKRTVALEALVRWNHPERGVIPAAEFIPVAEATGLIVPLGRWVLRTACSDMADFIARGAGDRVAVTVNLSPTQLHHPDIITDIEAALADSGLPASRLVLEVAEGVISGLDLASPTVKAIHALGVGLAIDDFGTGYSALSYLSLFPIDHVKIDRSFVSGLGHSARETDLTRSVVKMASQLKFGAIAEGIETSAQLETLQALGCPYGQGYLFSRPVPVDQIARFMGLKPLPTTHSRRRPARPAAALQLPTR